ncbi:hypothetical protein D3C78_1485700 [compost metagenome]
MVQSIAGSGRWSADDDSLYDYFRHLSLRAAREGAGMDVEHMGNSRYFRPADRRAIR